MTFTITVKKVSARDFQTRQSDWLPGGEQLLQSHLSVHSAWNVWERGWSKRLTWVQDIEISVQDRPATLHSQASRTATYLVAFAFSFLVFFLWFWGFVLVFVVAFWFLSFS